jgi:hypothetical protein
MNTHVQRISLSLLIGIAATVLLTAAASLCFDFGAEAATRVLSWPNTLLQTFVPQLNIGTAEEPFYEGTPLNILAYIASFPLSIGVYSLVAYMIMRKYFPLSRESNGAATKSDEK